MWGLITTAAEAARRSECRNRDSLGILGSHVSNGQSPQALAATGASDCRRGTCKAARQISKLATPTTDVPPNVHASPHTWAAGSVAGCPTCLLAISEECRRDNFESPGGHIWSEGGFVSDGAKWGNGDYGNILDTGNRSPGADACYPLYVGGNVRAGRSRNADDAGE